MDFSATYTNGYYTIKINEPLSMLSNISFLRAKVAEVLKSGSIQIAIWFDDSSFLSSNSITTLIMCNELVRDADGELLIIGGGEELERYLEMLGIRDRFSLVTEQYDQPALQGSYQYTPQPHCSF